MANLNGALENKTLQFTEKDYILSKWRDNVLKSSSGNISRLVRAALRYYIKNNETCCIGKVFLTEQDLLLKQRNLVSIYLGDSPDIVAWMNRLKQSGIKTATIIKSILYDSIQCVDSPDEEWIPESLELFRIELLDSNVPDVRVGHSALTLETGAVTHTSSASGQVRKVSDISNSNDGLENSSTTDTINTDTKPIKKKPRAYAFSGKHFRNA